MLCMKSIPPKTKMLKVTLDENGKLKNPAFLSEEPPRDVFGYRQACSGESGAGFFIGNGAREESIAFKYILASIHTTAARQEFEDDNGETHQVPCGSYTWNRKKKRYLHYTQYSQSVAAAKIHDWVKARASICKSCTIL